MARLKRVLWYLLSGTRGGPLRIKILRLLRERPYNTNQVATELDIDYKTAQHHLEVLTENNVVSSTGQQYGAVFLPTDAMEDSWAAFDEIVGTLGADEPDADDASNGEATDDGAPAATGAGGED